VAHPEQTAVPAGAFKKNLPDTKSRQARQIDQTVAADVLQVSVKERKPE
jgi:hypothetical protein